MLLKLLKSTNNFQNNSKIEENVDNSKQPKKYERIDFYNLVEELNAPFWRDGQKYPITIPERHIKYSNEHIRVVDKIKSGCRYFISQAIYNLEASKNFLSDYYYYCQNNEISMVPIIFTLTPCGSTKTLEFMKWLGIYISRWLENDLLNSEYILDKSVELLTKQFVELHDFANDKKIPIGCNIESVSIKKAEIEASIQLVDKIQDIMRI